MKKYRIKALSLALAILSLLMPACKTSKDYVLTEKNFFLVLTNMWYYPTQYLGSTIECDLFTYEITDVHGEKYLCGVRKCSSGYGCTCGKDTVIGFILHYDGDIPAPKNQSEDTNDKSWIHIKGGLKSDIFVEIEINAYKTDGSVDEGKTEKINMLAFDVETLTTIEDASGLNYYVTK